MEAPHMFIGRDRGDPYPDLIVQQVLKMVTRDRKRPSVFIWPIANEPEWYDNFDEVARLVKEVDPTRPTIFNHGVYNASDAFADTVDLLVLDRSISGTTPYDFLERRSVFDQDSVLGSGEILQGSVTLQAASATNLGEETG